MNFSSIAKMTNHISNGWIIGCSIFSCGILTCAYLNSISNIPIMYIKRKNRLELEYPLELVCEKIKKENKIISYYWNIYKVVFITGMTGLTVIYLYR
jgi:hypothetical protein